VQVEVKCLLVAQRTRLTKRRGQSAGPDSMARFDFYGLTVRIADSSSINALNFSFARTTKRFPSPRCASAIQIVRPLESIAETQPQLQPALLRFSAMISQLRFTPQFCLFCSSHRAEPAAYRVEISCADHTATIHRTIKTKSDLLTARIKSIHRS